MALFLLELDWRPYPNIVLEIGSDKLKWLKTDDYIYLILHAPERKTIAVNLGQTIFKLQGKMTLLLQDKVKYEFKKK